MSERRDQNAGGEADDEVVHQQDLSVPMWVWTLLGFVLVVTVIIVVIIIGGGQARQPDQGGGQPVSSATEPAEPETMPSESPTTNAAH